jgi:hypothetical protein
MATPRKRIAPKTASQISVPAMQAPASAAPTDMSVSQVDKKHEEYDAICKFYSLIGKLYRGGYELQQNASQFLRKRPVEPPAVYTARVEEFTYQNVLQAGVGWYQAALYTDPPEIYLEENDERVSDGFLDGFLANADRCGHSLLDCSKKWLTDAALNGVAFVLIDLPASTIAKNFREQKARGDLDAYITTFDAAQVINWSCDQSGNYEWIVISTTRAERVFGKDPRIFDQWYYFDATDYRLYESERPDGTTKTIAGDRVASCVAFGKHALADQNRVPVRKIELPDHLWLAYRVYLQVLDHLNTDNAFSWALKQSNLAVAVITGAYEDKPVMSETAFIHLPEAGSTLTFAEPSGRSFSHSANRVRALIEEVYRQMHLQAQGRSSSASASANSGYSKEMDMAPSKDIANAFGDIMRQAIKGIAEDAALIAGRTIEAEVSGLEAQDDGAIVDIAEAEAALDLNVPSPTFDTYVYGRVASRVMRRAPPDTKTLAQKEIETAPSRQEMAAQQMKQQQQAKAQAQTDLGAAFTQSLETQTFRGASKQQL